MKKLILGVLLTMSFAGAATAQTYYYKCIESVNERGERSQCSGGMYVTFTNNSLYESDANGYKKNNFRVDYLGTDRGLHVYEENSVASFSGSPWSAPSEIKTLMAKWIFSSDFQRLNYKHAFSSDTQVYIRANPGEGNAPENFW